MQCDYFDAARCRSCTLMGQSYAVQLDAKQRRCESALTAVAPDARWMAPFASAEAHFRNKAKLVVGGGRGAVTVGILDTEGHGVDLRDCGLYEPGLASLVPLLADAVDELGLEPYDVPRRQGELKHLIVTHSPAGEIMVRFVLRSRRHLALLESRLPGLLSRFPQLTVVSVNLQPEHKAILEGDTEITLTERDLLRMRVNDVTLNLRPNSFFQTNTAVAAGLYRQARDWVSEVSPESLWDLYCGVGGFALHCLDAVAPGSDVVGIEVSTEAVASARLSADELEATRPRPGRLSFHVGDATAVGRSDRATPELVIVNPPRRGIGPELAGWLDRSGVRHVVYSSCNVDSLARDLSRMPSFATRRARLFDMFPQTSHHEVMVLLERA